MIIKNAIPISKRSTDPVIQALLNDLQGNILKAHAKPHATLLFITFQGGLDNVKSMIRNKILPRIISMSKQLVEHEANKLLRDDSNAVFCSFSLSKSGYDFLGIVPPSDSSYLSGMHGGTVINDSPISQWEEKFQSRTDALIICGSNDSVFLDTFVSILIADISNEAIIKAIEKGRALTGEKEHFGFADGISQPRFFEEDVVKEGPTANWDSSASLDLVLVKDLNGRAFNGGFTGEDDFPVSDLSGTHSYGSYLVFRKLQQDIDGWNQEVLSLSQKTGLPPQLIGAFAVGRFQDGTPVINHNLPQSQLPHENDFNFSADSLGLKCPYHAHIRKVNPRGDSTALGATLEEEKRRRIARRGIPYSSEGKKGLLFMCYQSNIADQFEFMQNMWVDNKNFAKPSTGIDTVIGQGNSNPQNWPNGHGGPGSSSLPFGKFVHLRGGAYFFTPSISFLQRL